MNENRLKGSFTLKFTDEKTNEVREIKEKNMLISYAVLINTSVGHTPLSGVKLSRSSAIYKRGNPNITTLEVLADETVTASTNVVTSDWTKDEFENGFFATVTFRFGSTGVDQTFQSLGLHNETGYGTKPMLAYTSFDDPYVQGPAEVLDITYRITGDTTGLTYAESYKLCENMYRLISDRDTVGSAQHAISFSSTKADKDKLNKFTGLAPYISDVVGSTTATLTEFFPDVTVGVTKEDYIGSNIKSISSSITCSDPISSNITFDTVDFLDPNEPLFFNYPFGPLFNHNSEAISWYEDVGNLATGLGYPIVTPMASPTYKDIMGNTDMHVIRITKTGNVGDSRYDVKVTPLGCDIDYNTPGFKSGQTVNKLTNPDEYNSDKRLHNDTTVVPKTLLGIHSSRLTAALFPYNSDIYVLFNTNASNGGMWIYLRSMTDDFFIKTFDTGTTVALPDNGVDMAHEGITRDDIGNIYYIANGEIVKISDPLNSPVVTTITAATMGITGTIKSISSNLLGMIVVVSDNGYSSSFDNGATWSFSMIDLSQYKWIELSDNNNTESIIVDNGRKLFWFDLSTNTITTPPNVSGNIKYISNASGSNIRTDPKTGLWIVATSKYSTIYLGDLELIVSKFGDTTSGSDNLFTTTAGNSGLFVNEGGSTTNETNHRHLQIFEDLLGNLIIKVDGSSDTATAYVQSHQKFYTLENATIGGRSDGESGTGTMVEMSRNSKYDAADFNVDYPMANSLSGIGTNGTYRQTEFSEFKRASRKIGGSCRMEENIPLFDSYYRWDTSVSEWKLNWNKDATPTADGSSSIGAKRLNFDTDENNFSGYSSLDLTPTITGESFSNGLTFVASTNNVLKDTLTFSSTWEGKVQNENPLSCIMEIFDTTSNGSIALQQISKSNNTMLLDRTNPNNPVDIVLEQLPDLEVDNRYVLTISSTGDTVKVYRNGNQIGSNITLNSSFTMNSSYDLTVGSRNRCDHFNVRNLGSNFKGSISNIQLFNRTWSSADVTSDSGDISGLINNTNLLCRFTMDEDYQEGKVTHLTDEETPYGMLVSFPEGNLSDFSYVRNENYVTIKNKYGIVKDNVTSFNYEGSSTRHAKNGNECTSPITGLTTIPLADGYVTEYAKWDHYTTTHTSAVTSSSTLGSMSINSSNKQIAVVQSSKDANWNMEFELGSWNASGIIIKFGETSVLTNGNYSTTNDSNTLKIITLHKKGVDKVEINGIDYPQVLETGDKFKLDYIHSTSEMSLYLWNTVTLTWDLLGLSQTLVLPIDSSVSCSFAVDSYVYNSASRCSSLTNVKITYLCRKNVMYLGDKVSHSGSYSFDYKYSVPYGTKTASTMKVKIDGVEATVTNSHTASYTTGGLGIVGTLAEPNQGNCIFYPSSGLLLFNPLDEGKTITVENASNSLLGLTPPVNWYI